MNEEFKFQIAGTAELMTFPEIDKLLKQMMQDEIDAIENRLVEVFDRRQALALKNDDKGASIGRMPLHDILIKFR